VKYLKTFELLNKPNLKKYIIWIAHPDSELYYILEIHKATIYEVVANFLYMYDDKEQELIELNESDHVLPTEEFLDENIIEQSNNLDYLKEKLPIIKSTNKYNL